MKELTLKLVIVLVLFFTALSDGAAQSFNYPVSDCYTYTYKLSIESSANELLQPVKMITGSNGLSYLLGSKETALGKKEAFLVELKQDGTYGWSTAIGSVSQIELKDMVMISNTAIVCIGSIEEIQGGVKSMLLVSIDVSGNILWSKRMQETGFEGSGISALKSGQDEIAFIANKENTILFGCLSKTGDIIWSKLLEYDHSIKPVGIVSNSLSVCSFALNHTKDGKQYGTVSIIEPYFRTIRRTNQFGGPGTDDSFLFSSYSEYNGLPNLAGIYQSGEGNLQVFHTTSENIDFRKPELFEIDGISFEKDAIIEISAVANTMAVTQHSQSKKLYIINYAQEYGTPFKILSTKSIEFPDIIQSVKSTMAFDAGHYFGVGFNNKKLEILKTDSLGLIPLCPLQNAVSKVKSSAINSIQPINQDWQDKSIQFSAIFMQESLPGLTFNQECKQLSCPNKPASPSCLSSFSRSFRSPGFMDTPNKLILEKDGQFLIAGYHVNPINSPIGNFFARFNPSGELLERYLMNFKSGLELEEMRYAKNGDLIIIGKTSNGGSLAQKQYVLARLSPDFQLRWSKAFDADDNYAGIIGLEEGYDETIYISFTDDTPSCLPLSIMKFSPGGELIWQKHHAPAGYCRIIMGKMTQDSSFLYFSTHFNPGGNLIAKVNKATGDMEWAKVVRSPDNGTLTIYESAEVLSDKILISGEYSKNSAVQVLVLMNKDGTIAKTVQLPFASSSVYSFKDHIVLILANMNAPGVFAKLDDDLNLLSARYLSPQLGFVQDIAESPDGNYLILGSRYGNNQRQREILINKVSEDGELENCPTEKTTVAINPFEIHPREVVFSQKALSYSFSQLPLLKFPFGLQENKQLCLKESTCDNFSTDFPLSVCDSSSVELKIQRSIGCTSPISFRIEGVSHEILKSTDSTVTVKFLENGSAEITASMFTGCEWIEQSAQLLVTISGKTISLGKDSVLCEGATRILNAGSGFSNYLWNTGETDSLKSIRVPGFYRVQASNACGNLLADSITIVAAPPIDISLGPDQAVCLNDSIILEAPDGFVSYEFAPSYQLTVLNNRKISVRPRMDTSYFIRAEKSAGCYAYDTIHIRVNSSLPVSLGPDRRICEGDSLHLLAPEGFAQIRWEDGTNQPIRSITRPGSYSIIAFTANGCSSEDTLQLLSIWPKPVIDFPSRSVLCVGETLELQPGIHSSYLWQDGSSNASYTANSVGKYKVTVTNEWGCNATDSVVIRSMQKTPAHFLPSDTVVCKSGSIRLQPNESFHSLRWNTGSTGSFITVKAPGWYSVTVEDKFGCIGWDSVHVKEIQCLLSGIYFPNAFTPNMDGKNDQFKPVVSGDVKNYHLSVYNRFGMLVFESYDYRKGWDGLVQGQNQNPGNFVWTCTYSVDDQISKTEKGSVLLVR